jgi:iron complex outermembrane receptor protein/vitamin B12 transporter
MKSWVRAISLAFLAVLFSAQLHAWSTATISGTVRDALGAVVPNAKIELIESDSGRVIESTSSDERGSYSFSLEHEGRFWVRAAAASFRPALSAQRYAGGARTEQVDLTLFPSMVAHEVVVTATGVPTPELQTGASIGVIGEANLATRRTVEQEMRLQPGVQADSAGQPGSQTLLRVRGGPSDANKVLIDGVPANDIGGGFDFSNLGASGYEKVELFRGPNSALFGSDALASVVNITTRRGVTALPELSYSVDGGRYDTYRQEGNLGGAWQAFDYFTDVAHFNTANSTPNSQSHNGSYLGNVGYQILPGTELRGTVRRWVSAYNAPNSYDLYKIADDGVSREEDTSFGVTLQSSLGERWNSLVRYAGLRFRSQYTNFGPTGIPYNTGYGTVYLGNVVTITGANGYSVTGQGILQYGPGSSVSPDLTNRDSIYAQTDYRFSSKLTALFGFRYEAESGYTTYISSGYSAGLSSADRGNYSYMMQLNGGLWNRLYYTVGSGLEHNAVFGFAATPRASLAFFAARPRQSGFLNGTRLTFNFGKGIKEASIDEEANSMYALLQQIPASGGSPSGAQLISQYGIGPFHAELSRTYDGGVQQMLLHGRARVSLTYFHNEFGDQAEFVPFEGLSQFGVQQPVISALETNDPLLGGVYANSLDYRAQGAELDGELHLSKRLVVSGGWSYTDAVVQHSLSSDALSPAINPVFPTIPIGAFAPLVGARPFRVAPNTGKFSAEWDGSRWSLRMTGTMVSRRDDSTFLYDQNYGYTMLLPNRNLDPSYQKLDLYGNFQLGKRMTAYASIENLLNQHYYEVFGYPALPFAVRSGVMFRLGGESWKLR